MLSSSVVDGVPLPSLLCLSHTSNSAAQRLLNATPRSPGMRTGRLPSLVPCKFALLHTVEEYLHQKVKDARMYKSVLDSLLESVLVSVYTSAHGGILRVMVYVFRNLLCKPAPEQPMCLLWIW
jgi:hypothetical protein